MLRSIKLPSLPSFKRKKSKSEHVLDAEIALSSSFEAIPTPTEEHQEESQAAAQHLHQEDTEAHLSQDAESKDGEERELRDDKDGDIAQEYATAADSDPGPTEDDMPQSAPLATNSDLDRLLLESPEPSEPSSDLDGLLLKLNALDLTDVVQGKLDRIIPGGCADIHVWVLVDGKRVAEKRIRFFTQDDPTKVAKRVVRELRIWFKLRHPNILPLKGYIRREHYFLPSIITEWMENGSLQQFLKKNNEVDEIKMVKGITDGLSYLHGKAVVHGDLKAANVVISQDGVPMLMDFGISHLLMATTVAETATSAQNGSLRWAAPELVFPDGSGGEDNVHTQKSDIWALGMTYLEVLTKNVPYSHIPSDFSIIGLIFQKTIPKTPVDWQSWTESKKQIWGLCLRCWNISALERPSAEQLALELEQLRLGGQQKKPHSELGVAYWIDDDYDDYGETSAGNQQEEKPPSEHDETHWRDDDYNNNHDDDDDENDENDENDNDDNDDNDNDNDNDNDGDDGDGGNSEAAVEGEQQAKPHLEHNEAYWRNYDHVYDHEEGATYYEHDHDEAAAYDDYEAVADYDNDEAAAADYYD